MSTSTRSREETFQVLDGTLEVFHHRLVQRHVERVRDRKVPIPEFHGPVTIISASGAAARSCAST